MKSTPAPEIHTWQNAFLSQDKYPMTYAHLHFHAYIPMQLTAHPTNTPNHTNPLQKERDWHKHMLQFYLLHLRNINISGYLVYHLNSVISNEKIKKKKIKKKNFKWAFLDSYLPCKEKFVQLY